MSNAALERSGVGRYLGQPNPAIRVDACGLQRGDVQKYIRTARVVLDETEAAVGLPYFQSACSHRDLFPLRLQPELQAPAGAFPSFYVKAL